jgi:hypothetical protein
MNIRMTNIAMQKLISSFPLVYPQMMPNPFIYSPQMGEYEFLLILISLVYCSITVRETQDICQREHTVLDEISLLYSIANPQVFPHISFPSNMPFMPQAMPMCKSFVSIQKESLCFNLSESSRSHNSNLRQIYFSYSLQPSPHSCLVHLSTHFIQQDCSMDVISSEIFAIQRKFKVIKLSFGKLETRHSFYQYRRRHVSMGWFNWIQSNRIGILWLTSLWQLQSTSIEWAVSIWLSSSQQLLSTRGRRLD